MAEVRISKVDVPVWGEGSIVLGLTVGFELSRDCDKNGMAI